MTLAGIKAPTKITKDIINALLRNFNDYHQAWLYALKMSRTNGPFANEYKEAAHIITESMFNEYRNFGYTVEYIDLKTLYKSTSGTRFWLIP